MSNFNLSVLFFLQLAVILATCRVVGLLARKVGQPQVVGEMIAGVLLGPSLFGLLLPGVQGQLFPQASMTILYAVAQVGVALYMFLVGLEFQASLIRNRLRSAASISVAGMLVPFALGSLIARVLAGDHRFFMEGVSMWEGMLYLGAAMCITAFPMLARIIYERGLTGTSLGTLALAAGCWDDATAWCLLAIVLASMSGNFSTAALTIGGGALYALATWFIARPLLKRLGSIVEREGSLSPTMFSFVIMLAVLGSWVTDRIGIYAVFGAFVLGMSMPRGMFAREVQRSLEPVVTGLLLPLFFVYSGLNTRIGLVATPFLWLVTILILLAACLGKGVACWLAARLNGESQRDAIAVGTLMNSRGLMELIILSIGLEHSIITPTLYTIMVLMAVLTTLMASPIFELVYRRRQPQPFPAATFETNALR